MRKASTWSALLLAGLLAASPASAAFSFNGFDIGDPVIGGSWTIGVSGGGQADLWRIDWVSGQLFELPTLTTTEGGWSTIWNTSTSGAVSGPSVLGLSQSTHYFAGAPTDDLEYNFAVYNGGTLQGGLRIFVRSGNFGAKDLPSNWDPGTTNPIPEPMTSVLLGLGLLGAAARRRKRQL